MHNFWFVAKHEYRRIVGRRAFILLTLTIPLGLAVLIALIIYVEGIGQDHRPVGFVDRAGILDESRQANLPETVDRVPIQAYNTEDAALRALRVGEIQAFFILPTDYPQSLRTDLYYMEKPPSNEVWRQFDNFVRLNLIAKYPQAIGERLYEGADITVVDIASKREFRENDLNFILPLVAMLFFLIITMSSAEYMLRIVADEKENRMMEVMLTTLTPGQLIGGKALGLLAVTLTQVFTYILAIMIAAKIAAPYIEFLQHISIPWTYLWIMALFFFSSYALTAAMMIVIGSATSELQQGQQVAGLLSLVFTLPIFLSILIFENPAGIPAVILTLFPTSAFVTISLRWGLGTVPVWQLVLSWLILITSTGFMLWAAAKVFRAGMLRYGQPLTFKSILVALSAS